MTTLPLKMVKLLPDRDVQIGGVKSALHDADYELTLLCEAQLVRYKPRKPRPGDVAEAQCIPLHHFGKVVPAPAEPAQAVTQKK